MNLRISDGVTIKLTEENLIHAFNEVRRCFYQGREDHPELFSDCACDEPDFDFLISNEFQLKKAKCKRCRVLLYPITKEMRDELKADDMAG